MKKNNLLITGGTGFVGRNLIRVLNSDDYDMKSITVIDKDDKYLDYVKKFGVNVVCADLSKKGDWFEEFEGKVMVINLAAQISSPNLESFYDNNVLATKNLIDASKKAGVGRIIHFSSAAVHSVRKDEYANSKLKGEELVKKSGIEYCILQPSIIYGPTDDKNIGYLINFAKKIPVFPIPGHGKWPRQPIYIDDLSHLVISIMEKFPKNKAYSVNGKEIIHFKDMIKTVLDQLGGFKIRVFLPIHLFKLLMMGYQRITGKIQFTKDQVNSLTSGEVFPDYEWWEEFDIDITSFEEGVKKMVD